MAIVWLTERIDRVGAHRAQAIGDEFRVAFAFAGCDREGAADGGLLAEAFLKAGEGVSRVACDDDRGFELRPGDAAFLPGAWIRDTPFVKEFAILGRGAIGADEHADVDLT